MALTGKNISLPIYHKVDGTDVPFNNLVLHQFTVDSVVMSLGDKITGNVYYHSSDLQCTMQEYVVFNGIEYTIVNPPTLVKEGMVSDNSDLKGMSKYSFEFYHPMYILGNLPFTDVAVSFDELRYKSQDKTFSWIGKPVDFVNKLNKNLEHTEWVVVLSDNFPQEQLDVLSEVLSFDNNTIADVLKTGYETWGAPFVVDKLHQEEYYHTDANNNNVDYYTQGKRFVVVFGLPSNEIYESETARLNNQPFVFRYGQGVGLKNNSRTPRNNKIVTRIAGYGSENNIPYGYPQVRWYGNQDWDYTINNEIGMQEITVNGETITAMSYPIYNGIVGGELVKLIKHPFTRNHLMPTIYAESVFNKVSQFLDDGSDNPNYNPDIEIKDYYDAVAGEESYPYVNLINQLAPSYEIHGFDDIKPELGQAFIVDATPINADLTNADSWDDTMDDNGNYLQSYFKVTLPQLEFDIYACAAITQEMQINMRSGACIGCTFTVQVDWEDYKVNFYDGYGNFAPYGQQRNYERYPNSYHNSISVIVQKDINTFGTLMPNIYQKPYAGDAFVVLGISLPLSYITSAQERLDAAMKSYMLENNVYYFDYPLRFDEFFLANNTNILNQIRPNTIIRFLFNGMNLALFVKQLTIKFNENKLPQYDITLTDNVEIVLNQIGQVADDVEHLGTLIALLRQQYSRNVYVELAKKLSKVDNDIAQGRISFAQGLETEGYFSNNFLGYGAAIEPNGKGEFEEISVRGAFRAAELIFNRISSEEGESIRSVGHGEILSVIEYDNTSGRASLKLDGNEWASIDVGDICKGVYNTVNKNYTNSQNEGFDDNGFRKEKGFFSSYFVITNIVINANGSCTFDYELDSNSEHPCVFMKFSVYGNVDNTKKHRQSSIYTTAIGISPRVLFLTGVNTFKIQPRNIKLAYGNVDGIVVIEELLNAQEYENSIDVDKFTANINGILHYYQHKTLEGDSGFFCEDNIYLGGIINQFKAAALDSITSELGVLGQTWILSSVDTYVIDCDSDGKALSSQTLSLWGELMYGDLKLTLDTTFNACSFERIVNDLPYISSATFSNQDTRASHTFTFQQGENVSSHTITIILKSIETNGAVYSSRKTISVIANKQGERGDKGDSGASIIFLGTWSTELSPVWNENVRNCVKHNGTYWLVNVAEDGTHDLGEPSSSNTNWENIGAMRFVATELLLAEEASINNLVASKLVTGVSPDPHVVIEGSLMSFYGSLPFPNIRLGVDNDGCAILKFFDKNGTFLYNIGPDGLTWMSSTENSFETILLKDINSDINRAPRVGDAGMLCNISDVNCSTFYIFVEGFVKNENDTKVYKVSGTTTPSSYNTKVFNTDGMTSQDTPHPSGTSLNGWYLRPNYGNYAITHVETGGNVVNYNTVSALYYYDGDLLNSVQILFKNEHDYWRSQNGSIISGNNTTLIEWLFNQISSSLPDDIQR